MLEADAYGPIVLTALRLMSTTMALAIMDETKRLH
jgi:hypothetical protein